MSNVQEIEAAIERLSVDQFLQLRERFQRRFDAQWDTQFGNDVGAGSLDQIAEAALAEHRAWRSTSFPPDAK